MSENCIEDVNKVNLWEGEDHLSEQVSIEDNNMDEINNIESTMEEECVDFLRPQKREREEDDQEWQVIKSKEKRIKSKNVSIELYISCNEKMPKLFSLAKTLKSLSLFDIEKVKFVTPYKVRVEVKSEKSALALETSQELLNKGWRVSRAMEVTKSFGVIKNVDLDLDNDDILKRITCPGETELLSVYRLKRRDREEDGWKASESVRLCFKGSSLPGFVTVDGLLIRIEPYVFPVSQCSKCWKLGHITKRCPSNKIICPKCGGEHPNCEIKTFICVNCKGNHMALNKSCPAFIKEKKLRDIMAEFNCSYRRALTMYVPEFHSEVEGQKEQADFERLIDPDDSQKNFPQPSNDTPTYAEIVKTKALIHNTQSKQPSRHSPMKHKQQRRPPSPFVWSEKSEANFEPDSDIHNLKEKSEESKREKSVSFKELLGRLKEVIFLKGVSIQSKVRLAIKYCIEWVVLLIVDCIPDWPVLQTVLDFLCKNG